MKIYIAGIMQGSNQGHGIQDQDYRQIIRQAIQTTHPEAEILDPFSLFPDSVTYGPARARQVLFELADAAGASDILIAYLPRASMGTALEMTRAYDNGKTIISISPMQENWVIRALSAKIFSTLEEFCDWVRQTDLADWIAET